MREASVFLIFLVSSCSGARDDAGRIVGLTDEASVAPLLTSSACFVLCDFPRL